MQKLIRTSITIPEELYTKMRMVASQNGESVSSLITKTLQIRIHGKTLKKNVDPMSTVGTLKLGIKKLYNKRSELYEEHLKRKIGY